MDKNKFIIIQRKRRKNYALTNPAICEDFNSIINLDVREKIAQAFCVLDFDLKNGCLSKKYDEIRKELVIKKAEECKSFLNDYIDANVYALIQDKGDGDIR